MKAQPKGAAPVSKDVADEIRRKMAAPAGPPPAGMLSFNAPKNVSSSSHHNHNHARGSNDRRYDEYDNAYDEDYGYDENDRDYDSAEESSYRNDDRDHRDRDRTRDYYPDDGRDYRYDGGGGYRNEDYHDEDAYDDRDRRNKQRPTNDNDTENRNNANKLRGAGAESNGAPLAPVNASAQSKQYSAGSSMVAEGKSTAGSEVARVDAKKSAEPVIAVDGASIAVINAYLQRARSNVFQYQPVLRATYRELKHYVTMPCQPGWTARCYIERNRSGSKMLAPYYSICADLDGS
jgi:hypothetical protein